MRRDWLKMTLLGLGFAVLSAAAASSLDLGVEGWLGNLGFRTDRVSTDTSLPGTDYFWGLSVYGSQTLTDALSFETGFYADPILRNTSYTLFSYNQKILSVGIGPFFGFFNDTTTLLKSGISTAVRLELPGIAFISFRSDSSIGGQLIQVGDYLQSRSDISIGVYLPNVICTVFLNSRTFDQKAAAADVVDSLTEYGLLTDIYQKNVPYRLLLSFSYQSLSRSFVAATTTTSTLDSLILGLQVTVTLPGSMSLHAGLEGDVYSFGLGTLVGSASNFLFRSYAGVKMSLDSIPLLSRML
jgi:hypothetical protein